MAATWTKAGKVRRAFKAGPKRRKDRIISATEAVFDAGVQLHRLCVAMQDEGLSPDDVQAALVLMTPDTRDRENTVYVLPVPPRNRFSTLFATVEKIDKVGKILPLGIAFKQRDREAENPKDPKSGAVVWVQPFLTGPRAESALIQARKMFADGSGGKSTFN